MEPRGASLQPYSFKQFQDQETKLIEDEAKFLKDEQERLDGERSKSVGFMRKEDMVECSRPNCKKEMPESATICPHCGGKKCSACEVMNKSTAKRCEACREPFEVTKKSKDKAPGTSKSFTPSQPQAKPTPAPVPAMQRSGRQKF